MEIKVGEYVRNKRGYIGKVIKIRERIETYKNDRKAYLVDWGGKRAIYISQIKDIKHSNNIIDLIEVGDIIIEMKAKIPRIIRINNIEMLDRFRNGDKIYSIVTKEQFSSLEYII